MSSANLPLLQQSTIDEAGFHLSALTNASAALRAGKLPTSEQLATICQKLLKSNLLSPDLGSRFAGRVGGGKLSAPGKELVQRAREVLEALLRLGLEKNSDDKIQRFIYAASQASLDVETNVEAPDVPVPSSHEIADAQESLRSLLQVLLTSSQLRSTISQAVNLFRDLFADTADNVASYAIEATKASKKAAKAARPSEEERVEGKTGLEGKELPDAKDVKKQVLRATEDTKDDFQRAVQEKAKRARKYIDEELPTDAKDAAIERFKAIINEIQSAPQYQDSINTIFDLVQKYAALAGNAVKEAAAESSASVDANKAAESAASLFREIVESFTGPLDGVFSATDKVIKDIQDDERIKALIDETEALVDRAIHDPGYATSSKAQRRAEQLYDRAQGLIKSNAAWKKDIDALVNELNRALDEAVHDRALANLGRALDRFGVASKKFWRKGTSLVDIRSLWGDLTQVFLPRIVGSLRQIPLPRVEFTSADFDLALDNVRFTSASFLPDATYFTNHNELSIKKGFAAYASSATTSTTLSFAGLRLVARDISYYVNKKNGWLTLEDSGLLDVFIGSEKEGADDGLDLILTLENASEDDQETFFVVQKAEVAVAGFDIRIHDSAHPITNWFARGTLRKHLEAQFIAAMEEQIAALFKNLDAELYAFQLRAIGAGHAAPDPAAYLRALLTSSFSSSSASIKDTGITKVGPNGDWILAIGVEEELLPGKLTGLGLQGKDITAEKRSVEGLMEEGWSKYEDAERRAEAIGEAVGDTAEQLGQEFDERLAEERKRNGWKSRAFDL